jgi:hypothetical protein
MYYDMQYIKILTNTFLCELHLFISDAFSTIGYCCITLFTHHEVSRRNFSVYYIDGKHFVLSFYFF